MMTSGRTERLAQLPAEAHRVIDESRRAVLVTLPKGGHPQALPVCFAVVGGEIATAVDEKPKSSRDLARVRNVRRDPRVTLLFDAWDEDWTKLAWVSVRGTARIEPPGTAGELLADRYPQYREDPPRGEVIIIRPVKISYWSARA